MPLSDIVNVSISRETAKLSKQAFNTIAILSEEVNSSNNIEFASTLDEVADLLTGGEDAMAYKVAQTIFMQNPRPNKIALIPVSTTVTDALDAANEASSDWYMLVYAPTTISTALADMKLVADWVETKTKICGLVSNDSDIVDTTAVADETTIAAYIKSNSYARTFVCYSENCDSTADDPEFLNAAILSVISTWTPGSYTCKFKKLVGVTPSSLTSTQLTNAEGKYVNTYVSMASRGMFQHGTVGEGEWIDVIIFCDWQVSLIQNNVALALLTSKKVPFDDVGLGVIGSAVSAGLEAGISSGGYTAMQVDEDGNTIGGYILSVPKASEISASDKNAREISSDTPITFIGFLSGAIHSVTIQGKVTV